MVRSGNPHSFGLWAGLAREPNLGEPLCLASVLRWAALQRGIAGRPFATLGYKFLWAAKLVVPIIQLWTSCRTF